MPLHVDLTLPPEVRWQLTPQQRQQSRELLAAYQEDLGLTAATGAGWLAYAQQLTPPAHWQEMESIARQCQVPLEEAALGNLYYDALKLVLGCTAFAVDTPAGPLQARNLDWSSGNGLLSRYTVVTKFTGAPAGEFATLGWPGFVGVLSAVAPGRFAVSLNAALSLDAPQPGMPVVFLLRTVLEQARTFEEAVATLAGAPLPCDCLLLVTGTRAGEMAVVERTPSRHAIRRAENGWLCVTNDYRGLAVDTAGPNGELAATSCGRYDRATALLQAARPSTPEECLRILDDPGVRMEITVQQMVFQAAAGTLDYRRRTRA